jgi:hypothetical protein
MAEKLGYEFVGCELYRNEYESNGRLISRRLIKATKSGNNFYYRIRKNNKAFLCINKRLFEKNIK